MVTSPSSSTIDDNAAASLEDSSVKTRHRTVLLSQMRIIMIR